MGVDTSNTAVFVGPSLRCRTPHASVMPHTLHFHGTSISDMVLQPLVFSMLAY